MAQPTLSDVHIQTALTDLSIAYRQSMPSVATRLFPRIVVGKKSDKYYIWDKADMWRSEISGARAPGSHFDRAGIRLSSDTYTSEQYALEYKLPDEVLANQDAGVDLEMTAAEYLVQQHNLKMDLAFATAYMTTTAGWTSGTLTGSNKWSAPGGLPVTDVQEAVRLIIAALGDTGGHRMVGVCGRIVEARLLANSQVTNAIINVQAGTVANVRSNLAAILGIDELIVADRMRNTAKEGATASYSPVFDDDLLIVAVPKSPGLLTAAAGYTFAWNEGGRGDMYVERYRDELTKSDILRSVSHWGFEQTGAGLGVFFSDCVD